MDGPRMDPHNVPTQSRRDQSPSPSPSPTRLGPTVRTLLNIQKHEMSENSLDTAFRSFQMPELTEGEEEEKPKRDFLKILREAIIFYTTIFFSLCAIFR